MVIERPANQKGIATLDSRLLECLPCELYVQAILISQSKIALVATLMLKWFRYVAAVPLQGRMIQGNQEARLHFRRR